MQYLQSLQMSVSFEIGLNSISSVNLLSLASITSENEYSYVFASSINTASGKIRSISFLVTSSDIQKLSLISSGNFFKASVADALIKNNRLDLEISSSFT